MGASGSDHSQLVPGMSVAVNELGDRVLGLVHAGLSAHFSYHEFKNALQGFQFTLEILKIFRSNSRSNLSDNQFEEIGQIIDMLETGIEYANASLDQALVAVGPRQSSITSYQTVLRRAIRLTCGKAKSSDVRVMASDTPAFLDIPEFELVQVFVNVLYNAIEHAGVHGVVKVAAEMGTDSLSVRVYDSGPNVEVDTTDDLFVFGESRASGSGIGLFLVREYLTRACGSVTFDTDEYWGSHLLMQIPVF